MFRYHARVALRTLRRRPTETAINVIGLALGLTCCVLLALYVRNELAVDRDVPHAERIYRLGSAWSDGAAGPPITAPAAAGPALVETFAEVEATVRIWAGWLNVRAGDEVAPPVFRRNAYVADANALTFFGFDLLHGDPSTALAAPRSVVLHERFAEAVFGTADAVGRTLLVETYNNGEQPYTVTGVWADRPFNSFTHFDGAEFEVITSFTDGDLITEYAWWSWENRYLLAYVKLAVGADVAALRSRLPAFVAEQAPQEWAETYAILLESFATLYLDDNDGRNRKAVYLLSALAVLILAVACINFANLATARALNRAKEIGVRKAVGAQRAQLVGPLLGEAVWVAALATALGAGMASVLQGPFFELADKPLVVAGLWDAPMLLGLVAIALVTGLSAGGYPALVLSAFRPVRVLRGAAGGRQGGQLRRSLVVVQFAVALVLVAGAAIIHQQTVFLDQASLGFERDRVLAIRSVPRDWSPEGVERLQPVKTRLEAVPGVRAVSLSWETASEGAPNTLAVRRAGQPEDATRDLPRFVVDAEYDDVYGLDVVAGAFFSPDEQGTGVLLNERAAAVLGVTAPGELLHVDGAEAVPVRGIVRDFHFDSLHRAIGPLVIASVEQVPLYRTFSLRLDSEDTAATLAAVRAAWQDVLPTAPFDYSFLSEDLSLLYAGERRTGTVVALASALAFAVAMLGLFGLVSLAVLQRRKEIGVRKVLGASALRIVGLFVKDFGALVLIAVGLAAPLTYLAAARWLDAFAYRIDLGPGPFFAVGGVLLATTLTAVCVLVLRAALADPVRALSRSHQE
ncbi:MAG: ABC transporter permease [Bacteroidota bacterium]